MPDLAPTPEQYEEAFNEIYDIQRKLTAKLKSTFTRLSTPESYARKTQLTSGTGIIEGYLGRCTIGGNYIGITENGDYRSCGFHEGYRIGNVKDKKLTHGLG